MMLKYCGNQSLTDYQKSRESHADNIGFIFTQESRRTVTAQEVQQWVRTLPPKPDQQLVGVFVNQPLMFVIKTVETVPLDIVQLHGSESTAYIKELRKNSDVQIWKTVSHTPETATLLKTYGTIVDGFLVDTKVYGEWGGTGQAFDWSYIPQYAEIAHVYGKPCFIAGGIKVNNVLELLDYQPDGIDIASGIEVQGMKSAALMEALERKVVDNNEFA